jgi:hypothetical protein
MNLERVSNEEKLNLCRKYYLGKADSLEYRGRKEGWIRALEAAGGGVKPLETPILGLREGGSSGLHFWVPREEGGWEDWTPGG